MSDPFHCGPNPCGWPCIVSPPPTLCSNCIGSTAPNQYLLEVPALANYWCNECASVAGNYITTFVEENASNVCWWEGFAAWDTTCGDGSAEFDEIRVRILISSTKVSAQMVALIEGNARGTLGDFEVAVTTPIDCGFNRLALTGIGPQATCDTNGLIAYLSKI